MRRSHLIESAVFVIGIAIGTSCAADGNAQTAERIIPDDTASVSRLLAIVRGANPLVCELTVRAADRRGSWSNWGSIEGSPLVMDSASSALLDWVNRSHNDPALVAPLRTALRDGDGCVRRVAASLLSRVDHQAARDALRAGLDDAQAGTREVSAFGLGMARVETAAEALEGKLADGTPAVRRAAAWALGELEGKRAIPALIHVLARDPDAKVRQAAAWAIGNIR
jgi:HEAT repeat protein